VALRPSNAKRLYTDEKNAEIGKIKEQNKRKVKGEKKRKRRDCAATLSDLYPSTCLVWEALPGV